MTRRDGSSSATASILCTLGLARVDIRKLEDDLLRVRGVDVDVEVVRGGCHASAGADVNRLLLLLLLVGVGHRMIGEGTSCLELGRMMEVRWHPIVATVDGIVVDLVWVVVDMRGHNVHLSLRMGERMMMDVWWDYLVLIVALLVFIRRQPRR